MADGPASTPRVSVKVSIVLPTFNGSTYLAESLESCLAQTYPDFELIIVDDASTDATPSILAEYTSRDPRIRVVRHDRNRGLPAGLNTGFADSRGEYLTWTSDDNRYAPDALETMVRALEGDPTLALVYADIELIGADGGVLGAERAMEPMELLTGHEGTGLACFLYRRAVYERIGEYAEELALAEDYDYWLRVLAAGLSMRHLPVTLYQYRRHPRSLTDARRGQTFLAAERALLRHLPEMPSLDRELRGRAYLYLASLATWRGDPRAALGYTLRALPVAPVQTAARTAAKLATSFARRRKRTSSAG